MRGVLWFLDQYLCVRSTAESGLVVSRNVVVLLPAA
jgi:hypothetical protein